MQEIQIFSAVQLDQITEENGFCVFFSVCFMKLKVYFSFSHRRGKPSGFISDHTPVSC